MPEALVVPAPQLCNHNTEEALANMCHVYFNSLMPSAYTLFSLATTHSWLKKIRTCQFLHCNVIETVQMAKLNITGIMQSQTNKSSTMHCCFSDAYGQDGIRM